MNTPASTNTQSGAAMLGIVLVIIVILLALVGALAIGPQLQNITTERQTVKRANVIVDAVRQYYLARGELPEPSSVPVDKLNLEQKNKFDAWGQEWCYYRATIEDPDDATKRLTDITGIEVDTGSANALQVAGVLISSGPDQEFGSTLGESTSAMADCPDDGDDIDSITQEGDDIVIPLNVQAEAIQKTNDALTVLANRTEESGVCPPDHPDFEDFLAQLGLGTSTYADDPWNVEYTWGGGTLSRFISQGSPDGEIRSREINCVSSPPPGTPLAHIDFSVGFEEDMDNEDIASAHPDIDEAGEGASIEEINGETVLSLDGNSNAWVRLHDLITDPADFCEYTVMGWFRAGSDPDRWDPIITRQGTGMGERTFWTTLWSNDEFEWSEAPLVQRVSNDGSHRYFDLGIGEDENLFRDENWHFFAVNMDAENEAGRNGGPTCTEGGDYTCSLFASDSACTILEDSENEDDGPDVGTDNDDYSIYIGREYGTTRYFEGYISEIAIYSRRDGILGEEQIRSWYADTGSRYGCYVQGLLAQYIFEDSTDIGKDTSGKGIDGTADDGTSTDNSDPARGDSHEGTCRYATFDGGTDSGIKMGSVDLELENEMTVMAWVRWGIDPSDGPSWANIVSSSRTDSSDGQFWLQHNQQNTRFEFAVRTDTGRSFVYSDENNYNPDQDIWMHVAGVYNGSNLRVFVDGDPQSSTVSRTGNVLSSTPDIEMAIGSMPTTFSRRFEGDIDEVRIFNKALTESEIKAWMTTTRPCDFD